MDSDEIMDLLRGAPGNRHLREALDITMTAAEKQHMLSLPEGMDGSLLQYGPQNGSKRCRQEIASFLTEAYQNTVQSDDLFVTAGATSGLLLTSALFFRSGATVFVEDPMYFIALGMLKDDLGLHLVPVATDDCGIRPDDLERLLMQHGQQTDVPLEEGRPFRAMLYTVPTFNNPCGSCLPPDRCRRLVELAREHDLLVFCDDVYNLLSYSDEDEGRPPQRLLTYDSHTDADFRGHVISNGSFSKILAPGCRVGWIEAPPRISSLLYNCNIAWSGGCLNTFTSELIATAISLRLLQRHLAEVKVEYKRKFQAAVSLLHKKLPEGVRFVEPQGGFFIWLQLPVGVDAEPIADLAYTTYNLKMLCGKRCSPTGRYGNCIRIALSYLDEPVLLSAVSKLCKVISDYMETRGGKED